MTKRKYMKETFLSLVVDEVPNATKKKAAYTNGARAFIFGDLSPMPGCSANKATASPKSVAIAFGALGRFTDHHSDALRTWLAVRAAILTRSTIFNYEPEETATTLPSLHIHHVQFQP